VHFLRQLCGAVHQAHIVGLLHLDIKPSNVVVSRRSGSYDVVKLVDFGLAQPIAAARQERAVHLPVGSPAFMSPEQASGMGGLDARTDLYGLGGLGYYLLTGRPPFVGPTLLQTIMSHIWDPVAPLKELRPDLPADVEAVVMRCLAKDPSDRYRSVAALQAALGECACAGQWTSADAAAWWHTVGDAQAAQQKGTTAGPAGGG
jgi:serine/threonine-protein kinase